MVIPTRTLHVDKPIPWIVIVIINLSKEVVLVEIIPEITAVRIIVIVLVKELGKSVLFWIIRIDVSHRITGVIDYTVFTLGTSIPPRAVVLNGLIPL